MKYKIETSKKVKKYNKTYYENNKTEIKKKSRNYYQKNRNKVLLRNKKYREKNKEKRNKQRRKYYQFNKIELQNRKKEYFESHPWMRHLDSARQRCNNPTQDSYKNYGGRGIKLLMAKEDFKYLWFRDEASSMLQPSIDRKNHDGNYTLENCRFIEMKENIRIANKRRRK